MRHLITKFINFGKSKNLLISSENCQFTFDHPWFNGEFDWVASDSKGKVAIFSTAGKGPIPVNVSEDGEFLEEIIETIRQLPACCKAIQVSDCGHCTDWLEVSKRGFFGFDWDSRRKGYRLISLPESPLKLENIKVNEIQKVARKTVLPIDFLKVKRTNRLA